MTKNANSSANPIELTINELIDSINCDSYQNYVALLRLEGQLRNTSVPVRSDAVFICICTRGSAKIRLSLRDFELKKNGAFIWFPRDFLVRFDTSDDFEGRALVFNTQILQLIMPKLSDLIPLMIHNPVSPEMELTEAEKDSLLQYYDLIQQKIGYEESLFKKKKIEGLLQALMFEILELQQKGMPQSSFKKSRKEEIMANFIIAVKDNFRTHREVAFYANNLCITPKHLSAVVKEISGRPAGEWIGQHVIMEAKVLLRTTDHTIQEISSILNFPNQSFFGKYFKHITGMSPSTFRSSDL